MGDWGIAVLLRFVVPLVEAKAPGGAGDGSRGEERTEVGSSSVIPAVLCDRLLCDRLAEPIDRDETLRKRSI